ncbi:DUF2157 domain-containing protein [Flavobacterium sp. DGU11]|uniref:DUF2157 domain-containing protein n=1 Tax=Flavobacterium arundinis TaxID=3139143 RepID=A0ABU9I1U1_9FLAO
MKTILKELPELVVNDIITSDTAQRIEAYYASKKVPRENNLLTIFGVIGAVLTGLGIILIFAHNWDTFPKSIKTMLALLPLIAFQGLTAYTIIAKKEARWKEPAGVLLFFAVGASIALVAQIYNIPGNLGSYLCTWTLLCLPLIYILRSNALALLHIVFSTWYACEWSSETNGRPWMYLFFIAAFIPFYIERHRSQPVSGITAFLNLALPVSGAIALAMFLDDAYKFNAAIYVAFFGMLYSIGQLAAIKQHSLRSNGFTFVSQLGILILLLITSSKIFWEVDSGMRASFSINTLPAGVAFFAISLYIAIVRTNALRRFDPFLIATIIFPAIYVVGLIEPLFTTVLANLLVLGLGTVIIRKGALQFNLPVLNFGLVIVSALIICRFFDTDMSFAIRGLLFVVVGAGFFFANYLLIRKKKDHEITK